MGVTVKFNATLKNLLLMNFGETIVFVKFGTDWCIPCQELDKILVNYPNSMLYHVNTDNDEFENVMEDYNFVTIPFTIIKYKTDARNFKGVITAEKITQLINDMKN
tara:strand:- start:1049 stop:1366 length:318 start_codon:yes stop_codon:yes gene_type:complete